MHNNYYPYGNNNSRDKKLKIIFLATILSFGIITNIFSICSFTSNIAFLKDVQALETKENVFEYEKKNNKENNYYKNSNFNNSRYLSSSISSEAEISPTSLELDKINNIHNIQYKSLANIEKEIIECNNYNVNLDSDGGLTTNGDIEDENNNHVFGQILPNQNEETAINTDADNRHSVSPYDSKDSQVNVICKNLNINEVPSPKTETLTVIKNTYCQADPKICEQFQIQPSQFNIVIEEGNNPSDTNFTGSSFGTIIQLEPGPYRVSEEGIDPITPAICNTMGFDTGRETSELGENLSICTNFSEGCEGEITLGNPQTCTIHNVLVEQQFSGNNIYIVWFSQSDNRDIFFSVSHDNGQTFSEPINISNNAVYPWKPHMIVSGNSVYITWINESQSGDNRDIFFSVSNDNGQTFSEPINISNNGLSFYPLELIVTNNSVYIAWVADSIECCNYDIFFSVSHDNGETFSTPVNISNNAGFSLNPSMVISDNNVYIAWIDTSDGGDYDIFFSVSHDNGQTFDEPINISNNAGESSFYWPMLVSGDNVYIIWIDRSNSIDNPNILFSVSHDNGQTFDEPINISNNAGESGIVEMIVLGNNVFIAWIDRNNGGDYDVSIRISHNNGQTFDEPINISNNAGESVNQHMLVSGNNVYIVWADTSNDDDGSIFFSDYDIFFSVSHDNGQTFSEPIDISNNARMSYFQHMIVVDNSVYIVWTDTSNSNGGDDIFFSVSNDNGEAFSTPVNISNNAGYSSNPQMIVVGNSVYILWGDRINVNSNPDIFFSVSNDNGEAFSEPVNLSNDSGETFNQHMVVR
jgi:hypothetical protein